MATPLIFFSASLLFLLASITAVRSQMDSCDADLSSFLPAPFNTWGLLCKPVWKTFILRYYQSEHNTISIVLSSIYTSGWIGMGFSPDGMMVGSNAMVGWIDTTGRAFIKQYDLRGMSSSDVVVNDGKLSLTSVSPKVVLYGGVSTASSSPSSDLYQLKQKHGVLAIFGWGILLPLGAIIARYFIHKDPLWYYLHAVIQLLGYLVGFAAVLAGISLYNKSYSNFRSHKGLGISVLVLGSLQVIAFFIRPDKESKLRKYWNWYHHWLGRLALFLAAINIALGLQIGGASSSWKFVYGIILATILVTFSVLEIILWTNWSKKTISPPTI